MPPLFFCHKDFNLLPTSLLPTPFFTLLQTFSNHRKITTIVSLSHFTPGNSLPLSLWNKNLPSALIFRYNTFPFEKPEVCKFTKTRNTLITCTNDLIISAASYLLRVASFKIVLYSLKFMVTSDSSLHQIFALSC